MRDVMWRQLAKAEGEKPHHNLHVACTHPPTHSHTNTPAVCEGYPEVSTSGVLLLPTSLSWSQSYGVNCQVVYNIHTHAHII